jgi:hypothetical protein
MAVVPAWPLSGNAWKLGCYREGKRPSSPKICAAVVLAGETSLVGAVLDCDWVSSHQRLGRNRPYRLTGSIGLTSTLSKPYRVRGIFCP